MMSSRQFSGMKATPEILESRSVVGVALGVGAGPSQNGSNESASKSKSPTGDMSLAKLERKRELSRNSWRRKRAREDQILIKLAKDKAHLSVANPAISKENHSLRKLIAQLRPLAQQMRQNKNFQPQLTTPAAGLTSAVANVNLQTPSVVAPLQLALAAQLGLTPSTSTISPFQQGGLSAFGAATDVGRLHSATAGPLGLVQNPYVMPLQMNRLLLSQPQVSQDPQVLTALLREQMTANNRLNASLLLNQQPHAFMTHHQASGLGLGALPGVSAVEGSAAKRAAVALPAEEDAIAGFFKLKAEKNKNLA